MVSQFSISLSVWAILSSMRAYALALLFLPLKIFLSTNLPSPIFSFIYLSSLSLLMAFPFLTSHDSFSAIAAISAASPIISPLIQFLTCLNGFMSSELSSSKLFLRFALLSLSISFTTWYLSPPALWFYRANLSWLCSYFVRNSVNCL